MDIFVYFQFNSMATFLECLPDWVVWRLWA